MVTVSVTSLGVPHQPVLAENFYAWVGQRSYEADVEAAAYVNQNGWMNELNPGRTVTGLAYFDLPLGAKIDRLGCVTGSAAGPWAKTAVGESAK